MTDADPQPRPDRRREPAPQALVAGGAYRFGTYDGPIERINPLDVVTAPGVRGRLERAARNARLKEWEAFQLGDDDWFVLGAVYDTKSISLLQVLVVDKHAATIRRYEQKVPSPMVHVARGLHGTESYGHVGRFSVQLTNLMGDGIIAVDASHPGNGAAAAAPGPGAPGPAGSSVSAGASAPHGVLEPLELHGVAACGPDEAGHLVIVHPFDDGTSGSPQRALYSHKTMMPFAGTMRLGGDVTALSPQRSFMILDDHHGDYPSPMQYDWVTAVRCDADGRIEGFNLTDNQVQYPDRYNENAVWLGTDVFRLPAVHVERPNGPMGTWIVRDADGSGSVDVRFTPTVRSEMHVGPRRSLAEYHAPYGWFEGRIHTDQVDLDVDAMFGVGEQKFIRV